MGRTADARLHNAAVANANGAELPVTGLGSATFQVSGTFVATINFEGSLDGTSFFPIMAVPLGGGPVTSVTTRAGVFRANVAGFYEVRTRISGWASGPVTVDAVANEVDGPDIGRTDSSGYFEAITPDDNVDLTLKFFRALYIGVSGSLIVIPVGGTDPVTFTVVAAGDILPISVKKVMGGTSAGGIVGMA